MDGVSEHEDRFLRYETPSETSADAVAARPEHFVRVSTEGNTRPAQGRRPRSRKTDEYGRARGLEATQPIRASAAKTVAKGSRQRDA